ncbi:MAG: LacI family DNA-binding transcriptional regulator, partial [Bacteroidales bacterium]|nr:LacI family DNA-binding transcriptional regulator [Bacteroidales bacterium]
KDHPDINQKTRDAVKEMARKYNYRPNKIALSLLQNQSKTIGVIIPEIIHHFFSSVISGIEDVFYQENYNIIICQSQESYEREIKNVQTLLSSHIDGILMSISKETRKLDHIRNIQEIGLPLVFFDRIAEEINTDKVIVDDFGGGYLATEHLINIGCKRIAHLYGPMNLLIGKNRFNGYKKALEDQNMSLNPELTVFCDSYEKALTETRKLLQLPYPPDGIFAVNDLTAMGTIKTIKDMGFRVPEDVSVVGFTNWLISRFADPALTTIDQKGYLMGTQAAQLLLKRINNQETEEEVRPITKLLDSELIIRDSTRVKQAKNQPPQKEDS